MRTLLMSWLTIAVAGVASAGEDHACPMAASHAQRRAAVDDRHQAASSVPSAGSAHRFRLTDDGGSIHLEATAEGDAETRDRVRAHLQAIAGAFSAGDFSMPAAIHDRVPPGVAAMKDHRDVIRYTYAPSPRGGVVTIATGDARAREAVHAFLRFQIEDHATGDPIDR